MKLKKRNNRKLYGKTTMNATKPTNTRDCTFEMRAQTRKKKIRCFYMNRKKKRKSKTKILCNMISIIVTDLSSLDCFPCAFFHLKNN